MPINSTLARMALSALAAFECASCSAATRAWALRAFRQTAKAEAAMISSSAVKPTASGTGRRTWPGSPLLQFLSPRDLRKPRGCHGLLWTPPYCDLLRRMGSFRDAAARVAKLRSKMRRVMPVRCYERMDERKPAEAGCGPAGEREADRRIESRAIHSPQARRRGGLHYSRERSCDRPRSHSAGLGRNVGGARQRQRRSSGDRFARSRQSSARSAFVHAAARLAEPGDRVWLLLRSGEPGALAALPYRLPPPSLFPQPLDGVSPGK